MKGNIKITQEKLLNNFPGQTRVAQSHPTLFLRSVIDFKNSTTAIDCCPLHLTVILNEEMLLAMFKYEKSLIKILIDARVECLQIFVS